VKKTLMLVTFLAVVLSAVLPTSLQACESCADEGTCLLTWTGAQACTWVQKCRIIGTFPYETEVCWYVCKQYDFTCSVTPGGGPPRV
jgi:hypothetical protein